MNIFKVKERKERSDNLNMQKEVSLHVQAYTSSILHKAEVEIVATLLSIAIACVL